MQDHSGRRAAHGGGAEGEAHPHEGGGSQDLTPLERLLGERVVAGWLLVEVFKGLIAARFQRGKPRGASVSPSYLIQMSRILESATRRYLRAIRELARVRKLQSTTPGIQVNTRSTSDSLPDARGWSRTTGDTPISGGLEGVMNFSSETVAFWHGYSKTIPKRRLRRRVGLCCPLVSGARSRRCSTAQPRAARGLQRAVRWIVRTAGSLAWRYFCHTTCLHKGSHISAEEEEALCWRLRSDGPRSARTTLRISESRTSDPRAAILDSRALRSTPESSSRGSYDRAKSKKGSKSRLATRSRRERNRPMLDVDTFLTALYVIVDDFCQSHRPPTAPPRSLGLPSEGEVIPLSVFARWSRFASERDFYRYAESHLRGALPTFCPTAPSSPGQFTPSV
jgi:hypothetical protein